MSSFIFNNEMIHLRCFKNLWREINADVGTKKLGIFNEYFIKLLITYHLAVTQLRVSC